MGRRNITRRIYFEKSLFFLILFLFAGGFFYVTSCSNQRDITLRYKMEKSFYTSERMRGILSINLKAATPEDFKKLIRSYRKVIELSSLLPETSIAQDISDIASSAQLRIAELYIVQKNLDSAKVSFEKVLEHYPHSIPQNKTALLGLGQIYERRNQKEKAVGIYHRLLENYPPVIKNRLPDLNLFSLPNHLIQLFSAKEEKPQRDTEFDFAREYYQNLINSYPYTQISLAASLNLARSFQFLNLWKESLEILESTKDSTGRTPGPVLLQIGNIYFDELKDEKNALITFGRILESSADSSSQAEAQMKIGMVYFQKKDYSKAKEKLSRVKKLFPKEGNFIATCQYLIAKIYENTDEWDRALNEYDWLKINYPLTPEGLEAPLRIAAYYQRENKSLAKEYFEKSARHFDELLSKYKDKPFVPLIELQKSKLYLLQKDWKNAVASLQKIAGKYTGTDAGLNALLLLWRIYHTDLKDDAKSKEILDRIRTDYPGIISDTLKPK
ncbi:MAG: tetratricopeptide repeat protein [candidate division Zixibacteria bacterium]|nr:tetratricopeptide repeat protein [candidate division Zixibacteria bacterium]